MDSIPFADFKINGVVGVDTFEQWRQKTNGVIEKVAAIDDTYASESNTLLLTGSNQTVINNVTFSGGLTIGSSYLSASGDNLNVGSNFSVSAGKIISAPKIHNTSSTIKIGNYDYTLPSTPSSGYVYHHNSGITFKTNTEIANDVREIINTSSLTVTEDLTPVGMIVPIANGVAIDGTLWLACNGQTVSKSTYPDLAAALGETAATFALPTVANGTIGGETVAYYIRARKVNVAAFSVLGGNGITITSALGNNTFNLNGGSISLNLGSEFETDSQKRLILKAASITSSKLQNASYTLLSSQNPNEYFIPLRSNSGVVLVETPSSAPPTAAANKEYVDTVSKQNGSKFKSLNGKGYNSYSVLPPRGFVCVDNLNKIYAYGENGDLYGNRFGRFSGDAYGVSLPPYRASDVVKIYTDNLNTYIKYSDNKVYSYGYNINRKSGSIDTSDSSDYLSGPRLCFGGEAISEIILSYDADAKTAYALTTSGKLYTFGDNTYGQLGDNSNVSTSIFKLPVRGPGNLATRTVTKAWLIGGGTTQTGYALLDSGELWACGYGENGQIGRFQKANGNNDNNNDWVPVLSPISRNLGGTPTLNIDTQVYTLTNHGMLNYDKIKIGSYYYTVNKLSDNTFSLHESDAINTATYRVTPAGISSTSNVYTRITGVTDAYFGGIGANTFGILKQADGKIHDWGYNLYRQLGLGSSSTVTDPAYTFVPRLISSPTVADVYTNLDYVVHVVGTNGKLYGMGDNSNGAVGLHPQSSTPVASLIQITDFTQSGLTVSNNNYSVHRFFSSAPNVRFATFLSGGEYKLCAWGTGINLGTDISSSTIYARPQNVYVPRDQYVSDVQSVNLGTSSSSSFTACIIQDNLLEPTGDMYTCGYHAYNINSYPTGATVPFFTKIKNI